MFGYEDLLDSEIEVFAQTRSRLKGIFAKFPQLIDLSFYMQQSFGSFEDVNTEKGDLQSIAYMHICQFPYSLNVIYDLQMKGYYFESIILIRNVFEALIQLKYFSRYPQNVKQHFKQKIPMKKMIEGITENSEMLYDNYSILSKYAHGFIAKDICRTDRKLEKTYLGNKYNETWATISINWIPQIMLGYINVFDDIFNNNRMSEQSGIIDLKNNIAQWCKEFKESHIKVNPKAANFYASMEDLVNNK